MAELHHHGVMGQEYGRAREKAPALRYRYQTRAWVAADTLLDHAPGSRYRVLDLGAAEGLTLLTMRAQLGGEGTYDGVEYSEQLLDLAPPLPDNTRLIRGDVAELPGELEEGTYDLVSALAVLEHLRDPSACVGEAFRMLKPGGVFVATCPNPTWDRIAGRLGLIESDAHETEIDGAAMVKLCEDAGFTEIELTPFMWAPVGALPYLRLPLHARTGLRVDSWIRRLRVFNFAFVNQAVAASRPK